MTIPTEVQVALLVLAGAALTALGAFLGHLLTARAQKRGADVQAEANKKTAENELIDQLQEELSRYRLANDNRSTAQDQRMERLEDVNDTLVTRNDRYRDLLHKHRAHIWNQKPPPPPEWPDDLPR